MNKFTLTLAFLLGISLTGIVQGAWAQVNLGDVPKEIKFDDASIETFGHLTMTITDSLVFNAEKRSYDTLRAITNMEWFTDPGTAKMRTQARDEAKGRYEPSDFMDGQNSSWSDMYWFRFFYPSINANGEPITLSALAAFPDEDPEYINNVIIGCHVTITSNKEAPSEYHLTGSSLTDVGMLMWHASSGSTFHKPESNPLYYNLVILPDYEGYGITKNLPHPYLYQELTARQVVDATRYGIALYQNSPVIAEYRHPFRPGWKTASVGYSQGGSVAMATHRFIEEKGLDSELHFAGSVCGDGPYDPIAHVRYYITENGGLLNMPVVLPLILKGMLDSNPYMREHKLEDYLVKDFLDTGIVQWLIDKNDPGKEKTTDDVTDALKKLWEDNVGNARLVLNENGTAYIQTLMVPEVYAYFSNPDNFNALPTTRGVCEDLHLALESNNLTKGWIPTHTIRMWHYRSDTVVPFVNAENAKDNLTYPTVIFGNLVQLEVAGSHILDPQWDHVGGGRVFFTGLNVGPAENELLESILQ